MNREELEKRVIQVAEQVLQAQHYVSCVNVLLGIGYLQSAHFEDWCRGMVPYLEQVIHVNLNQISYAMECFQQWAVRKKLKPSETSYLAKTRGPKKELQFSKSGNPQIEIAYRTHYVSPELSIKKQKNLREKLEKTPELVVFWIITDSQCNQCHQELLKGSFLYKEQDKILCMKCSGFNELVFLPAGDVKLTRCAKKYSKIYAVVVRFSRARKRYERQGLLVQENALKQAGEELGVNQ